MGSPSIRISPTDGISPNIAFNNVDLPAPLGPIIPVMVGPSMVALQSFKTCGCIAYDTPTFLIVINEFILSKYVDSTIVRLP